ATRCRDGRSADRQRRWGHGREDLCIREHRMSQSLRQFQGTRFAMRAVLLFVLALLGGCASLRPQIETPRLAIVHVAMTSGDIFSQQFLVRMNVQNPNDRELMIRGLDYELFLEGDRFAE